MPAGEQKTTLEGERKAVGDLAGEQITSLDGDAERLLTTDKKTSVKTSVKSSEDIAARIQELMRQTPGISVSAISKALSRTERTIYEHIRRLKEHGAIRRVGPDKGGHWEVLE